MSRMISVVVGIFISWHSDNLANLKAPYRADVSKVLKKLPKLVWMLIIRHGQKVLTIGEPELGYFLSRDEYVIRKDMSMLADAGVDVLVMDVTNAVRYWDEWETLFTTMQNESGR